MQRNWRYVTNPSLSAVTDLDLDVILVDSADFTPVDDRESKQKERP